MKFLKQASKNDKLRADRGFRIPLFQLCQESLKDLPPSDLEQAGGRGALPSPCEAQETNAAHIFMAPFELACQSKSPRYVAC